MKDPVDGTPEIVLDLSRLVSRIRHRTPTGVDRVEMAYARELQRRIPEQLTFGAVHPSGFYGRLPNPVALRFLDHVERLWNEGDPRLDKPYQQWARYASLLWGLRPRPVPSPCRPRVVLQASPHHLDNAPLVRSILRRESARWICLLHDLIPIEYPEYARPGGAETHRRRMRTVARHADGIVANSEATRRSFAPFVDSLAKKPRVAVAHLGVDDIAFAPANADPKPYFLCLGTIEPRKNHLLLLNIWRDLSERYGAPAIPRLIVAGRRGWENEQVIDMLERCPTLQGCVVELHSLPDSEVRAWIAGACALLMPSFAEGYGMPVSEALALGTPVICSDLPALREVGRDVPDYLDPLDGTAWRDVIMRYADGQTSARAAQIARMKRWITPQWDEHMSIVLDVAKEVSR